MTLTEITQKPRREHLEPDDSVVPSEEYQALLAELRSWCAKRGRKIELSRQMNVSPTLVSFWLRGQRLLSLEQWLAIKKIMRSSRRRPKP
jgi:hypothetical protein